MSVLFSPIVHLAPERVASFIPQMSLVHLVHLSWDVHLPGKLPPTDCFMAIYFLLMEGMSVQTLSHRGFPRAHKEN